MKKIPSTTIILLTLIVSVSLMAPSSAVTPEIMPAKVTLDGMDQQTAAAVEQFVKLEMARRHVPGMAVGIVKGDKLVFAGYFGMANIAKALPVGESTLFRIGSISKTVTSIGLMQLWEQGKFKLDDDINNYLPRRLIFPPHPKTNPVTFKHLLTHTSGGGEFLAYRQVITPGFGVKVEGENYGPLEEYLDFGMHTRIDPGLQWAYCNYGFAFLGLALEHMSGEPFHEYMRRHVLDVLGMKDTTYHHNAAVLQKVAAGYQYKGGKFVEDPHKPAGITPAGSIYTNVADMGKYVIALLNGGSNLNGSVIKPETLNMMMSTQFTLDDRQEGWGLGFEVYSNNLWGSRIVGHSGSVPWGFNSQMLLVPSSKIGVYVFGNSFESAPREIAWGVLKIALGATNEAYPDVTSARDVWPKLAGYYGPRYKDFKSNARLYMGGIGAYRVAVIGDELKLIQLWRGKRKAKSLKQVVAGDPYFYRVVENDRIAPRYVAFKTDAAGNVIAIIPGGLDEYVKLHTGRELRARTVAVPGRIMGKMLPF